MPLTDFQKKLMKVLATNRTEDSYLAGGSALHISANSKRYSNDLDFFHDSDRRVAAASESDFRLLKENGFFVEVEMRQPGYVRAVVRSEQGATKVEWAHDSAWRFLPTIKNEVSGYQLHPLDLATNKLLALVGRNEARDFLDVIYCHQSILPLGPLVWAAVGKDPGFTPDSLLELLKRRGKYQPEDFSRLNLASAVDLPEMKKIWIDALESAQQFIANRPMAEVGCLYYSPKDRKFVDPSVCKSGCEPHYGRPMGVLPRLFDETLNTELL